jgi:hypothetical protein
VDAERSDSGLQGRPDATGALNATAEGGFNSLISFTVVGLPSGATPTFNPTQVVGSDATTLAVATDATAPGGTYPVTLTGVSSTLFQRSVDLFIKRAAFFDDPALLSVQSFQSAADHVLGIRESTACLILLSFRSTA